MRDIDSVLMQVKAAFKAGSTVPMSYVESIPEWMIDYLPTVAGEVTCSNVFVSHQDYMSFVNVNRKRWVYLVYLHGHLADVRKQMDSKRMTSTGLPTYFAETRLLNFLLKDVVVAVGDGELRSLTAKGFEIVLNYNSSVFREFTPSTLFDRRIVAALEQLKKTPDN